MSVLRALPPIDAQVMVIDDDLDLRDALCEVLRDAGYLVSSAGNGFDALRMLAEEPSLPDLILIDLMMPIMDGRTFREEQLQSPDLSDIPVIVISAHLDHTVASDLNAAAYLRKPVRLAEVLSSVKTYCDH